MRFVLVLLLLVIACNVGECSVISWVENLIGSNSTTATPPTPPCAPEPTLSPTVQALVNQLPPQLQTLATPTNIKTLENVSILARLATSAASGNPVAIVKLGMFLVSSDDPSPGVIDMSKQIAPILKSSDLAASFKNLTSAGAAILDKEFQIFKGKLVSFVNKKPIAT